ncbi:MAG TPA: methyltransferase domain-containing protein [Verrucomicrobiota bacterium]|nr:methyltransferase domain-containing protein [Verrucomicrobiota bacterium]HNU52060.1 methyltransferase domain-containing protein [Verrucomicrobiota bacterium]
MRVAFITALWIGMSVLGVPEGTAAAENRSGALEALCRRLDIGPGAVVADVGCGEGLDSAVFARVVGERGTVLAQEIDVGKLKVVLQVADRQGLRHVVPVLGQSDDPRLPDGFADLVYMNRVFHHFSQPRAMLECLWRDLKPGGRLVIVDQEKGPLTDWAPMASREDQHHWTGETTVVRLARETGFRFHDALEDVWHESRPFVLVFQKPVGPESPAGDPDLPSALDVEGLVRALPPQVSTQAAALFVGLDRGRAVIPALRRHVPAPTPLYDVILEEWAVSKDELPPECPHPGSEVLRGVQGIATLPEHVRLGLVLWVDAYHRVWEPQPFLLELKKRMDPSGLIAVVDREDPEGEPRRLAGHRRRLASQQVRQEMLEAGYQYRQTLPAPARDRYFLLFGLD